jgi:hypothetical protein
MTELTQEQLNTMPLDELEKMVSGIPTSQMDTENPAQQPAEQKEEPKVNEEPETTDSNEPKEEPKQEEQKPEDKEKKTPESIKKLLHQRSELRQDNDRLNSELAEAKELIRKLRS